MGNDWDVVLKDTFQKEYFKRLQTFLKEEYAQNTIYPKQEDIFNAFTYTPYEDVRVVMLGQDPYHGANQAHGLCFSVLQGMKIPPSLKNIYKELQQDIGFEVPDHGELTKWAKQGVLMLNTCLSVKDGQPASHTNHGWEIFSDEVISKVNDKEESVVFLLWGKHAQSKESLITNPKHLILKCAHPSPFSANQGFFGCRHFSKTNTFLKEQGFVPIDWQIEERNLWNI